MASTASASPRQRAEASQPAAPADAPRHTLQQRIRRRGRQWDDAPLRSKLSLLLVVAAAGGVLIGSGSAHAGLHPVAPLLGMALLLGLVLGLAQAWVLHPIDRLVFQLGRVSAHHRPLPLRNLPLARRDEVGQLARALNHLATWAIRDHVEASGLRRTLDDRVTKATRRATRRLARIAMRDPLTDLGNRRFLNEHLEPLIASCRESGEEVVCIIIDMDNFKQVNDSFGHGEGDSLLQFLARLIRASIRRDDFAVRLGGDEFVMLLPGCTVERAEQLAQRLLGLFRQHVAATFSGPSRADLSIGIAALQRDQVSTGQHLLEKADAQLYTAKAAGKGRFATA